jgi:hypothetical protein
MKRSITHPAVVPLMALALAGGFWLSSCKKTATVNDDKASSAHQVTALTRSTSSIQYTNNYVIIPSGNSLPSSIGTASPPRAELFIVICRR